MDERFSDDFEKQREMIHRNMLSSVSHDLKTPLASVIGSLEIHERMKDKLSQDKKEALIATALQEAYRLDNFVTNILEMAKLEHNMVRVTKTECHIEGLIRDCMTKLGYRLSDVRVNLKPTGKDDIVQSDSALLSRAIFQILDNAVKYGGKPGTIDIDYGPSVVQPNTYVISIHDAGKGIPAGQHEAIFQKYTRFSKQDQQVAGTGLGLSITRNIMHLLGGSVSAEGIPGDGAVFTLIFPIK